MESMLHPVLADGHLLGRFINYLRTKEILEVLIDTCVALAEWTVVIQASTEAGKHIIGIEGCAIRVGNALLEGAGPFGGILITGAGFGQVGLGIGRTPLKGVQLAEELSAGLE